MMTTPPGRPKVRRILVSLDDTLIERMDAHTANRSSFIAHAIRRALEAENAPARRQCPHGEPLGKCQGCKREHDEATA